MMSEPEHVTVIAQWQVKPGHVEEVLKLVEELRQLSLAEPGCVGYKAFHAVGAPDQVLLLERYRDMRSIDAHRATPHFRTLVLDRILPMLDARKVEILRANGPG